MDKVIKELQKHLANAGFKSSFVSVQHLTDLKPSLENLLERGILSKDFYDEIMSRYGLQWHFEPPPDFPMAKSIIVTAVRQPKISVKFKLYGKLYSVIIPPTYLHGTDKEVFNILSRHLGNYGHKVCDALLPTKLLSAHIGLTSYGRNNIAYIDGWGSYFRLRAFFSDIPYAIDNWQELEMMDFCKKCNLCVKKCPTNSITKERFLIDASRCITYFNEEEDEFPEWIDPEWHNCLIGCMICQDICPANKDNTSWVVQGEEFSEEETKMILKGVPKDKIPLVTIKKLKKLHIWDYYDLLQRNLGMLIGKT